MLNQQRKQRMATISLHMYAIILYRSQHIFIYIYCTIAFYGWFVTKRARARERKIENKKENTIF